MNTYLELVDTVLKNGIRKIRHATKKKRLPNIAQKLPILDIVKPIADIINNIHPNKFMFLFFIFFDQIFEQYMRKG